MLTDYDACVSDCGEGKIAVSGHCVPCDGPCPKGVYVTVPVHEWLFLIFVYGKCVLCYMNSESV